MSQPLAHLYDLALRALDEQERRAEALRGRLGPVLAATALGASLLSGPLVGGERPASVAGVLALVVALVGLTTALAAARTLLTVAHRVSFDPNLQRLTAELDARRSLDDAQAFYVAMIGWLAVHQRANRHVLDRLEATFTVLLWGILVMLCGLAGAALVG